MAGIHRHPEHHLVDRIGWLRAAVLGANDGILSTASLIVGVAAAAATKNAVLVAGVAGLVAGAMSMATGEYVSVSSQSDTEQADLARERNELRDNVEFEKEELAQIYVKRGLEPSDILAPQRDRRRRNNHSRCRGPCCAALQRRRGVKAASYPGRRAA